MLEITKVVSDSRPEQGGIDSEYPYVLIEYKGRDADGNVMGSVLPHGFDTEESMDDLAHLLTELGRSLKQ